MSQITQESAERDMKNKEALEIEKRVALQKQREKDSIIDELVTTTHYMYIQSYSPSNANCTCQHCKATLYTTRELTFSLDESFFV